MKQRERERRESDRRVAEGERQARPDRQGRTARRLDRERDAEPRNQQEREHERDRGWAEAGRHGHRVYGPAPRGQTRAPASRSIPQTLQVPAILLAVEVQVPDRAAAGLDPPVLAIAAVVPPP